MVATNVALNLVALGATTFVASVVGKDEHSEEMLNLFRAQKIDCSSLLQSETRKTTVKTRVLGNNQQLLRIDTEQINAISETEEKQLIQLVSDLISKKKLMRLSLKITTKAC